MTAALITHAEFDDIMDRELKWSLEEKIMIRKRRNLKKKKKVSKEKKKRKKNPRKWQLGLSYWSKVCIPSTYKYH